MATEIEPTDETIPGAAESRGLGSSYQNPSEASTDVCIANDRSSRPECPKNRAPVCRPPLISCAGINKLLIVGLLLLGVDLAANAVNSLGFSWMYTIQPTSIWAFPLTNAEIFISLAIGYGWNIIIVVWFLFFSSSPLANGFSKNKKAIAFGLLLIGFCVGDWMSNFWAILNIPSIVTAYWVGLTLAINMSKSYALAYLYAGVSETTVADRLRSEHAGPWEKALET